MRALGFSVLQFQPFFRSVFSVLEPKNFGFPVLVTVAVSNIFRFGFSAKIVSLFGFAI